MTLDKRSTFIIKGVAIWLMLFHHLFYSHESLSYYDDFYIGEIAVINTIGVFCKVCVSIFVFVSGFGLAVSSREHIRISQFYYNRFSKLYLNYWFVSLLFVPISVFVFQMTFNEAYGENAAIKAILDFFGLLKLFGFDSYNPTWWFYSCIIVLYLLFPFINRYLFRYPYLILTLAVVLGGPLGGVAGIKVFSGYLLVFLVGILMSRLPDKWVNDTKLWHIVLSLVLLCVWRMAESCPRQFVESLICIGIALFVFKLPMQNWVGHTLELFGKHSMNIFLIHTFIFYFWFKDFIYITRNPLLIFFSLLLSSLLLSVLIEWIKGKLGFYKLLK